MLAEAIQVLATITGVDLVSDVLHRVSGSFTQMAETSQLAATAAEEAAARIDAGLLATASGGDAVTLATSQLSASRAKLAMATEEEATAEEALVQAQRASLSAADGDIAAQSRLVAAADELAAAQRRTAAAATEMSAAEARLAATVDAATGASVVAARESVAASDEQAAASRRAGTASAESSTKAKNAAFGAVAIVAGIGYEAVKSAMQFQTLTQRLVTTAGESQSALGQVRDGILQLSNQTGVSADDLAKSMYVVEAAGYSAAKGGMDVLKAATQGAALEGSDFATVANAVTDIMKDYHLGASKATFATSQLVAAVSVGKANFQSMSAAMANVLPFAASVHLRFADVAGVLSVMTSHGVTAQRASQNLANAIQSLEKPSATMQKEFKATGITTDELNKHLSTQGLGGTLQWLSQVAAANAPKLHQTYTGAFSRLIGTSAGLRVALMTTGENARDTANAIYKIDHATGAANGNVTGFAALQKTAAFQMDRAKEAIKNAAIAIGTALLPEVVAVAQEIAKVVGPLAAWIEKHQQLVITVFKVVGALIAVFGAIKMVIMVAELLDGALALVGENPIVAALVALVLILVYCYTHFKTFRDIVNDVFKVVGVVVKVTIAALVVAFKWLVTAAIATWHALETAWNAVASAATALWGSIVSVWNAIVNTTMSVWNSIKAFFEKWWPLLLLIFAFPIAVLIAIWNHFHTQIIGTAKAVWGSLSRFFVSTWQAIVTVAQAAWGIFKTVVIKPVEAVWAFIQPAINAIGSFLAGQWNNIVQIAQGAWALVRHWIVQPLVDAWNWLTGFLYNFYNIGINLINGLIKGIEAGASYVVNAIVSIAKSALHGALSFLGIGSPSKVFADQVGKWIPHGIAAGIDKHASVAHDAVRRLAAGLKTTANSSLNSSLTVGGGLTLAGSIGGGGSSSASELHIHVDLRGAQIMSDRDTDALLQKMEKRLATMILPSGGYRSRF
jgi:TP901 family phage tail tape measure protein